MGIIDFTTNKFMFGMSVLESYIRLSNKINMYDINIVSENFFCNLLNVLYDYKLINKNREERNAAGFDLISRENKIIIQVTRTCTPAKINETIDVLKNNMQKINLLESRITELKENGRTNDDKLQLDLCELELKRIEDIRNYRLKFLFLVNDSQNVRNKAELIESPLKFNPEEDIIDFSSLCSFVHHFVTFSGKEIHLLDFMKSNRDLFEPKIFDKSYRLDRVNEIIGDYARNFESRLFLHRYDEQSKVTLKNMYITPPFIDFEFPAIERRDIIALLCDFLWKRTENETNDNERILFIEGDAAIGKTSLVSWLCYNYQQISSTVDENNINSGDIGRAIFLNRKMVCVRLRELDLSESKHSPEKTMLKYLEIENREEFNQKYKDAIFVLDGADELAMVSGAVGSSIETFVLGLRQAFVSHKFIITSRPKFLNMQVFENRVFTFRRIELTHYNAQIREEWMGKYKKCNEIIPDETERYIKQLSDNNAEGVADTPLALYLLVRCKMKTEMQGNNWALFHQIFSSAIVDGEYNDGIGGDYRDFSVRKSRVNYSIVENVAFKMFQNSSEERYFIRGSELEEIIKHADLDKLSPELVKQTCVLCAYWKNTHDLGALEFYHNNIRDFFLCEYIYDCLLKCFSSKSSSNLEENLISIFCEIFQWGSISGTTWEQSFAFLYLRLRYESQYAKGRDSLYSLLKEKLDATQLIQALISSKLIWAYDYNDNTYVAVKKVITNSMLLVRLLQDFVSDQERLCLWKTEEQKKNWQYVNLYGDWQELLKNTVEIDGAETIGVASKTKFEDAIFARYDLSYTQFNHCSFQNVSFSWSDLTGTNFSNASLSGADFSNAILVGADFSEAVIENVSFDGANLSGAKFDGATIRGCTWENCVWSKNRFVNADVEKLSIVFKNTKKVDGINLTGAKLNDCIFRNIKFTGVTIFNTKFQKVQLKKCEFGGTISDSYFRKVDFSQIQFSDLKVIQDCMFCECNFGNSSFTRVHLVNVTFKDSNLYSSTFAEANIDKCSFEGKKTIIRQVIFRKARNNGSSFIDVNINEANLQGAQGFDDIQ